MYVRIEAYDLMGAWRIHAVVLDQNQQEGCFDAVLDRIADVPRLDSTDTPADVLASVANECNNLAWRG